MANCNDLFQSFNSEIKLSDENLNILRSVRDGLRERMETRYYELSSDDIGKHRIEFQSQGSFVMDTIITPKDDDFDLDDGVYFIGNLSRENRQEPDEFHRWVLHAVGENENYAEVKDKDPCVRIRYKKEGFHIDLPIYYADNMMSPDLAHKTDGWTISNPIEFIAWFENKTESGFKESFLYERIKMYDEYIKWSDDIRKKDAQLRRIVRYLKAWGDNLRGEMPPGIIITILTVENYSENERDDLSLRDTLLKIREYLNNNGFKCPRPTTPKNEDLFNNYSATRKSYFKDAIDSFILSANQAIASINQREACLKWKKHLGDRFPCHLATEDIEGAKAYSTSAILRDNATSAE